MNMKEKVSDYFHHYYDRKPINILGIGESFWSGNRKIERKVSDLSAIEFVIDGKGILENNGKTYELSAGDVFLLRKETHHVYYNKNRVHEYLAPILINLSL